jgi:hypothetical protein
MSTFAIIKHRTGTIAQWDASSIILEEGEMGYEHDTLANTHRIKFGDGESTWSQLSYAAESNLTPAQQRLALEIFNSQTAVTSGTDRTPFSGKIYIADPAIVGTSGNNIEGPSVGDLWFW